jgi:hypothetical protein
MTDEERAKWFAKMESRRDAAKKALDAETHPKKRRSLRAKVDRYKAIICLGPERTSEASAKARETMAMAKGAGR